GGRGARRLRARRSAWRLAGDHPDRNRQRGEPRRRLARTAAEAGRSVARGVAAVVGNLRAPVEGIPRQRAAADGHGPSRDRAGLGARLSPAGVNFSGFSRDATRVDLLFFDRADDHRPARTIMLDPVANRTYHYWHVFVPGIKPGQLYGYRAHGPFAPERGIRF